MFEIYWSNFYDAFVMRSCDCVSFISPEFIGTREECLAASVNFNPFVIA